MFLVCNIQLFKKLSVQEKSASSQNLSRRLSRLSTDVSMDGKGNKNSLIMAHNEIGEQLWLRTIEGSGKFQVSPLPSKGTTTIKLPVTRSIQDSDRTEMAQGRSGKFMAIRIGDAEVKSILCHVVLMCLEYEVY